MLDHFQIAAISKQLNGLADMIQYDVTINPSE